MQNVLEAHYEADGTSTSTDSFGMRPMQSRVYAHRTAQYLLVKAPPASGKSRALMYVGLDKLKNNAVDKVIVAVPERSIAKSFLDKNLIESGFHSNWHVSQLYNLCISGDDCGCGKVAKFKEFLVSTEKVLICTHATLRFAYEQVGAAGFARCLVAIDELHHASAAEDSRLGLLIRGLIAADGPHIMAMTGSYFRGDSVPVMMPEDEARFERVTYNYYEQLNGYRHLKSLGVNFHFYDGRYTDSVHEVLDTDKKTILHIPSVNSNESTKDKLLEVDSIISSIGNIVGQDPDTGIITVERRGDGKKIKIADLVNDDLEFRAKVVTFLRMSTSKKDVDLIIALGMAKEGFDWPWCEHTLTIGYRNSLTEIIQIIGRCTRDCEGKTHAQFTNLVAEPDATQTRVVDAVNDILKAVTASLLMEQVLAPNFNFRARSTGGDDIEGHRSRPVTIGGLREPSTPRVKDILNNDMQELAAEVLQDPDVRNAFMGGANASFVNQETIGKIIVKKYPDLTPQEAEEVRQHTVAALVVRPSAIQTRPDGTRLIRIANQFVDVRDLRMDLIDSVNPLAHSYEVLSKKLTTELFREVQAYMAAHHADLTDEEAAYLWPKVTGFYASHKVEPSLNALDPNERRLAEVLAYMRVKKFSGDGHE